MERTCNPNDRAPDIEHCEGNAHRYDVGLNASGHLVVTIYTAQFPDGNWEVATRVVNPSPADLAKILNHAFMAGMEYEGYNRDCRD